MSAGRSIVPRYFAFVATSVNATTVTGAPDGISIFAGGEVEGFTRTLEAVESMIEDNQTSLDAIDVNIEGFIRGQSLLATSATAVNKADATGNRVNCKMVVRGAPGTLGFAINNVQVNVNFDTSGVKERVRFKGTKRVVRDVGVAGSDLEVFTSV